jgi:hypothetical protein
MSIRSGSRRSLLAVAAATVPLGAQAAAIINLPTFGCSDGTSTAPSTLQTISWGDGVTLGSATAGSPTAIIADIFKPPNPNTPAPVQFSCVNNLYSTGTVSGDSFAVNFGQLPAIQDSAAKIEVKLEFTSYDYKLSNGLAADKWISDFNLYLDKIDASGALLDKYFVGVQVISPGGSALSSSNSLFVDTSGNLIFDPPIPGGSAEIRLLPAPDTVPEPASAALVGLGLVGMAATMMRRRNEST